MPEIEYVWDELSDKWQKKGAEKGDAANTVRHGCCFGLTHILTRRNNILWHTICASTVQ